MLASASATFPGVQPTVSGNSIVFAGGGPRTQLLRYLVNPGGTLPATGDTTITATWDLTRLSCSGLCAGDADDWDPELFLTDGTTMFGFVFGDNNGGQVLETRALDNATFVSNIDHYGQQTNTGYPAIGSNVEILLSFTLHDDGITAAIRFPNVDRSYTWATPLARTSNLALVLAMDNDSGERYQVNGLQFPVPVPVPGMLSLIGLGLVSLATVRRRKQ